MVGASQIAFLLFQTFFPLGNQFRLMGASFDQKRVLFYLKTVSLSANCFSCGTSSNSIHSNYEKKLADLPLLCFGLLLVIRVRRFFCKNPECSQKIFTESIGFFADRYSRMTTRLHDKVINIGLELGGEAAYRVLRVLNVFLSADTILRKISKSTIDTQPKVRVLGVDDWAWKKGQRYGTVLVDLEKRKVIDLLPDRSAESLKTWLQNHTEVEVISRDRASAYAKGAREGAPQAAQVADRWHLLKNYKEVVEKLITKKLQKIREICNQLKNEALAEKNQIDITKNSPTMEPNSTQTPKPDQQLRWQRKKEIYDQVKKLDQEGVSQRRISNIVGIARNTVRRYLECESLPKVIFRSKKRSILDPFKDDIIKKWNTGIYSTAAIFRDLKAKGYKGGDTIVRTFICELKKTGSKHLTAGEMKRYNDLQSPRKWIQLLLFEKEKEDDEVNHIKNTVIQKIPELDKASQFGKQYREMMLTSDLPAYERWKTDVKQLGTDFENFIDGLNSDDSAIRNAIAFHWSNGQVEGQVNRIKALKRQMYGRAGFQLLRQRVLFKPILDYTK